MIIQRRVALQPSDVARCVEQTDLGDLPREYFKFLPLAGENSVKTESHDNKTTNVNSNIYDKIRCFYYKDRQTIALPRWWQM